MRSLSIIFLSVTLVLTIADLAKATNYCDPALCRTATHVACNNTGAFSSKCPNDVEVVNITPALKKFLVDAHNAKRNYVAGGADANHEAACRMATMAWNDELASLAALNVKQCEMKHDNCRNTAEFRYSGQNLAWMGYFGAVNEQERLEQAVNMWYNEIKNSNMTYIRAYPSNYQGPTIGHFTVMMAEKNTHLGCAAVTYSEKGQSYKVFLLACNYATTNIIGNPIYKDCKNSAGECNTGTNPTYPNLCSTAEKYVLT